MKIINQKLAKFIGGKRINFSHKGSYELRCNAAVTAYNEGANRLSSFNKQITDKSPGMYTKQYIKKSTRRIENHSRSRCLFKTSERTKTAAKPLTNTGPDENYGNVLHDPFLDLTENQIEAYKRDYLDKLFLSESQIKILEMRTRRQHQCEEWCIERKKRLTASIFGKVCKMRDKTSRAKTVNDILFGTFTGNAATRDGIANEVIAKEQPEDLLKIKIQSAGLIVDKNIPFIAASPDGILDDESLVEIKCPASAKELAPEDTIQSNKIKYCSINMVYQGENMLVIESKAQAGCRVLLNRADLIKLQYLEWNITETVVRKSTLIRPVALSQFQIIGDYIDKEFTNVKSPPKNIDEMIIFIKNLRDDSVISNMPKNDVNLISQLKMYASSQLAEQWAQRWSGEMSPELFTECEVRLISPPRYSSMSPMHDEDDFSQARAADEDRGIKELLTQATWAPTKSLHIDDSTNLPPVIIDKRHRRDSDNFAQYPPWVKKSIPRGHWHSYTPCLTKEYDGLLKEYEKDRTEVNANHLIGLLDEERKKRWLEAMDNLDFTHSSRESWTFLRKLGPCSLRIQRVCRKIKIMQEFKDAKIDMALSLVKNLSRWG
ncbi:hypothetical protein QTP88_019289 [Uroleucon formosanum]